MQPPPTRNAAATSRRALTLVELLVAIAIIAVLAALLVPAAGKARSYALRVRCAANLRQIHQACVLFANDHSNLLPRPASVRDLPTNDPADHVCWGSDAVGVASFDRGVLWRYLPAGAGPSLVLCPADGGERAMYFGLPFPPPRNISYSFNGNIRRFRTDGSLTSIKLHSVLRPAERVMVFEELAPNDGNCVNPDINPEDYPSGRHGVHGSLNATREFYDPVYLKQGFGNHVFFDGHVEALRPADIIGHTKHYRPLTAAAW